MSVSMMHPAIAQATVTTSSGSKKDSVLPRVEVVSESCTVLLQKVRDRFTLRLHRNRRALEKPHINLVIHLHFQSLNGKSVAMYQSL